MNQSKNYIELYLPIKSENLGLYFADACIAPTQYYRNRGVDFQSNLSFALILTSDKMIKGCDCSLKVVLIEQEWKFIEQLSENIYILDRPIPISRVKEILFCSKKQKETTLTNIEINTAFIPELLKKTKLEKNTIEVDENIFKSIDKKEYNWDEKLKYFNQLLGGFALMRIAYDDDKCMNYASHFIQLLAQYNKVIKQELSNCKQEITNPACDKFHDIIRKYYSNKITGNILQSIAEEEHQKIKFSRISRTIENLDLLNNATYISCILYQYKVSDSDTGRKNIDTLILERFSNCKHKEFVAFYYGYNRGYNKFSKEYTNGEKHIKYKFELDSQLDYYIIESLYQRSFNREEQCSGEFQYLDDWCPKKDNIDEYACKNGYRVLDTYIIDKKKGEESGKISGGNGSNYSEIIDSKELEVLIAKFKELYKETNINLDKTIKEFIPIVLDSYKETKTLTSNIQINVHSDIQSSKFLEFEIKQKELFVEEENKIESICNRYEELNLLTAKQLKEKADLYKIYCKKGTKKDNIIKLLIRHEFNDSSSGR